MAKTKLTSLYEKVALVKIPFIEELRKAEEVYGVDKGTFEGGSLTISAMLFAFLLIILFFCRDFSVYLSLILLPTIAFYLFSSVPCILLRIKRANIMMDALAFLLNFCTESRYLGYMLAFRSSCMSARSEEFREAWVRVVTKETTSVEEALIKLSDSLRVYSEQLYLVFSSLSSEIKREKPDFPSFLKEAVSMMQVESTVDFDRFSENISTATVIMNISPIVFLVGLPFFASMMSYDTTRAFIAGSFFVALGVLASVVMALKSYPSYSCFVNFDKEVDRHLVERVYALRFPKLSARIVFSAILVISLLSFASRHLVLITGIIFVTVSHIASPFRGYLSLIMRDSTNMIAFLRNCSVSLGRGKPLERVLSESVLLGRFASILREEGAAEIVSRIYIDRGFHTVARVFSGLRHSGELLAASLQSLRDYLVEVNGYRSILRSRIGSSVMTVKLNMLMIPGISLFSLAVLAKLSSVMKDVGAAGALNGTGGGIEIGILGIPVMKEAVNALAVMPFLNFSLVVILIILAVFLTVCEEYVFLESVAGRLFLPGIALIAVGICEMFIEFL